VNTSSVVTWRYIGNRECLWIISLLASCVCRCVCAANIQHDAWSVPVRHCDDTWRVRAEWRHSRQAIRAVWLWRSSAARRSHVSHDDRRNESHCTLNYVRATKWNWNKTENNSLNTVSKLFWNSFVSVSVSFRCADSFTHQLCLVWHYPEKIETTPHRMACC